MSSSAGLVNDNATQPQQIHALWPAGACHRASFWGREMPGPGVLAVVRRLGKQLAAICCRHTSCFNHTWNVKATSP